MVKTKGSAKPKAKAPAQTPKRPRGTSKGSGKGSPVRPEPKTAEACPAEAPAEPASASTPEEGHPDTARLLTSLKYQLQSKKSTDAHREAAEKILNEYKVATRKRKWQIMNQLATTGFKDLSAWEHTAAETHGHREGEVSSTTEGMFTKHKILQLNGFQARDFTPEEADQLLEDLLLESEGLYKHERNAVMHPSNEALNRYYYKLGNGKISEEELSVNKQWTSTADLSAKKLTKLVETPGEEATAVETTTESYRDWAALLPKLRRTKVQLQGVDEQLVIALNKVGKSTHSEAVQAKNTLQATQDKLHHKLQELLLHLSEGNAARKKQDECEDLRQSRAQLRADCEDVRAECVAQLELSKKCW